MRQVMSTNKDIASGQGQIFGQLMLDCEVALIRIGILKVLLHRQREREHRAKTRECLVVESLSTKLVLRTGRNAWSYNTGGTNWCDWTTRRANSSLEYLSSVE